MALYSRGRGGEEALGMHHSRLGDEQLRLHLLHRRQQVFNGEGNHEYVVGAQRQLVAALVDMLRLPKPRCKG